MAAVTGKRKRGDGPLAHEPIKKAATDLQSSQPARKYADTKTITSQHHDAAAEQASPSKRVSLQIVTGSYERVLHGICATIPSTLLQRTSNATDETKLGNGNASDDIVAFSDTFLFAAHASSIRCLAVSPATQADKRILATGGSDERVNLYQLSTAPLPVQSRPSVSLEPTPASISSRNRPLGNLNHHDRAITRLHFPIKSKLFSAAEDSTVAISRTRDWTVLSSIKAPIPKPQGRPSGDTAGPGEVPAGINDFAIHPSQKLMLSVGRGERCMRLWNLMTGKKAGVLNFDRDLLAQIGEGKHSSGEGRQVLWDDSGEMFVIAFERGAVLFGIDSKPKAVIRPSPPTKVHQMRLVPQTSAAPKVGLLAISTEDGRILFYDTRNPGQVPDEPKLPHCGCVGQIGGRSSGISVRVKDFEIVDLAASGFEAYLVVAGSSDGAVRLWTVFLDELSPSPDSKENNDSYANGLSGGAPQIGRLIGTMQTENRVTCLGAFVLDGKAIDTEELETLEAEESESSSADDDSE